MLLALAMALTLGWPGPGFAAKAAEEDAFDVEIATLSDSAHAKLDCSDCHVPRAAAPGLSFQRATDLACARCHEVSAERYAAGVHASDAKTGVKAAGCVDCHGAHDMYASRDPRSRIHKRRIAKTCGRCHQNPDVGQRLGMKPSEAASSYAESIHGRALIGGGLIVAPSCVDCHRSHAVQGPLDTRSSVHATHIVETCGTCHQGIAQRLVGGVHKPGAALEGQKAFSCVDCHSAHSIQAPEAKSKLETDERCGACHEQELVTHLDTYHGKAHVLGGTKVAACYDCHGHHDILPASDAASPVGDERKLQTCRNCHPGASQSLAAYLPHGNRRDPEHYPALYFVYLAMTLLVVTLTALFAVHALAWSVRVLLEYIKAPKSFLRRRAKAKQQRRLASLLRPVDYACYTVLLGATSLLFVTGTPLKFAGSELAKQVFAALGGAEVARGWHGAGATLALGALAVHLARLGLAVWRQRTELVDRGGQLRLARVWRLATSPGSPWIGPADLGGLWAHTKWFLARGPQPRFQGFTYWEKLDYTAGFLVLVVIFGSGLALWFPEVTLRLVPGSVLNVAQIVHGEEALLAVGSLLSYHVFHVFVLGRLLAPPVAQDAPAAVRHES